MFRYLSVLCLFTSALSGCIRRCSCGLCFFLFALFTHMDGSVCIKETINIFQTTKLLQKAHYMTNPHDTDLCPGLQPPGPNPGGPNPLAKSGPSYC